MPILLLALSVLPVIIILIYIYKRDKYEKEPVKLLLKVFAGGVLSVFATLLFVIPLALLKIEFSSNLISSLYKAFVEAAIPEEFFKFVFLYWFIWKSKEFNEKFDGIIYAVYASLGFACVENILYVFDYGIVTGITRAFLSVPAHALFGVIMGYYFSLAKFEPENKTFHIFKSLFFSILAHGIFDFILFYTSVSAEENTGIAVLGFFAFFGFVFFLWRLGFRKIKAHSDASIFKEMPENNESLNNS